MSTTELTDYTLQRTHLNGIYRGVVENNTDPLSAGRCQIRVFGVHTDINDEDVTEGIPTEHLRWAEPCIPIFGGVSQVGIYGVPCQGAHVFLFFESGNIMQPRYFATAPGVEFQTPTSASGFSDPDEVYPKKHGGQPDWGVGKGFKGKASYTNSFIIQDKAGNRIEMDSTPGHEQIIIGNGKTPSVLVFDNTGGIRKDSSGSTDETKTGHMKTTVGDGGYEMNVTGPVTESSGLRQSTIHADEERLVKGGSDVTINKIDNRTSGGLKWNIKGDSDIITAGKSSYCSDGNLSIKSTTKDVKIDAMLQNIAMTSTMNITANAKINIDLQSLITAKLCGLIQTTVGGGVLTDIKGMLTTVTGDMMVKITGNIIMIG